MRGYRGSLDVLIAAESPEQAERIYDCLRRLCSGSGVIVEGGDLSQSPMPETEVIPGSPLAELLASG